MTTIYQEQAKQSSQYSLIELYTLDTTVIGGAETFRFCSQIASNNVAIVYQHITYQPFPLDLINMGKAGTGQAPPQPELTVSNVAGVIMGSLLQNADLVGAKFTRLRTYSCFLDSGDTPDSNAHYPLDVFYIEQKKSHTKQAITFVLRSPLDRQQTVPRRQILRDMGFPGAGLFSGQFA